MAQTLAVQTHAAAIRTRVFRNAFQDLLHPTNGLRPYTKMADRQRRYARLKVSRTRRDSC